MANNSAAVRAKTAENGETGAETAKPVQNGQAEGESQAAPMSFSTRRNHSDAPTSNQTPPAKSENPPNAPEKQPANAAKAAPQKQPPQAQATQPKPPAPKPAAATPPKPAPAAKPQAPAGNAPGTPPKKPAPKKPAKQPAQVSIKPIAEPAVMRKRHFGISLSFLALVLIPFLAIASYLFFVAQPQYHSTTGFTVRSQEENSASELLGGLAQFAGTSTASDSDILYEFIQSQEMVQAVDARIDLRVHYAQHWPNDWVFAVWPDASREDLIKYWNRIIGVSYDQSTGLIEVQAKAFDPETAQAINQAIVAESQKRINDLNLAAREDAMRYATADLEDAVSLLKSAREALTNYRTQSQIVDPETDIQTRMGVMNSLQQELAAALVEYDLLRGTSGASDPRLKDTEQRIEVIRDRIAIERQNFASSSTETGGVKQDYPTLIAEFERLTVDREYAQEFYFASLTAMEAARDQANRTSRYLATYIKPTLAETSEYPQKFVLSGLAALFLILAWSIAILIYYSIRDRS